MNFTTQNTALSYSSDALITGAPITTDAAPTNLASVAEARRISIGARVFMTPGTQIAAFALGGSSTCVGRFWWYDLSQNLWVPNGAGLTLTSATSNSGVNTHGCMPGSLWFFQVTANAGGATSIAIIFR